MTTVTLGGSPPPQLTIHPGETVLVIGRPGSGKSTFAWWILSSVRSAIVYWTKPDLDEARTWEARGFHAVWTMEPGHDAEIHQHARALLMVDHSWLRPEDGGQRARERWLGPASPWTLALEAPFHRRPTALLFDEVQETFPSAGAHPGTARLLQQGRSRGHVPIILSQLANHIDTRLLRLAHHIVVLGPARNRDDLRYLEAATGAASAPLAGLEKRQIGWWRQEDEEWHTFEALDPDVPGVLTPLNSISLSLESCRRNLLTGRIHYRYSRPSSGSRTLIEVLQGGSI